MPSNKYRTQGLAWWEEIDTKLILLSILTEVLSNKSQSLISQVWWQQSTNTEMSS